MPLQWWFSSFGISINYTKSEPSCLGSAGRLDWQHIHARQKEKGNSKTQPVAMRNTANGSINLRLTAEHKKIDAAPLEKYCFRCDNV